MNVNRSTSGIQLPRVPTVPRTVDLTVTDRGVAGAAIKAPTVARPEPPRQPSTPAVSLVTSSARLQALLSTAETQALREAFAARPEIASPTSPSVYNLRGTSSDQRVRATVGGLMDFTG